jgi:hypothetical protein
MGLGYGALSAAKTLAGAKLDQQFSKKGERLFGGGTSLPYDFTIRSLGTTYERETEQQAYHRKQAAESRSRFAPATPCSYNWPIRASGGYSNRAAYGK